MVNDNLSKFVNNINLEELEDIIDDIISIWNDVRVYSLNYVFVIRKEKFVNWSILKFKILVILNTNIK